MPDTNCCWARWSFNGRSGSRFSWPQPTVPLPASTRTVPHQPDRLSFCAHRLSLLWGRAFRAICTVVQTPVSRCPGPFGLCRAAAEGSPPPGAGSFPCGSPDWHSRSLPCLWEGGSPGPTGALRHPAPLHGQAASPLRPGAPHRPLQRPSLCSRALTRRGGETLPGPRLLPHLSSVLFPPPAAGPCSGNRAKPNLPCRG